MVLPVAVPAALGDVLATVREFAGGHAREDLIAAGPEVRAGWLVGLQQLADAVAAATVVATEVFDAHGDGQVLHGAASTQAWLRGALRIPAGQASGRVQIARASRDALATAVSTLADGQITYSHLQAIDHGVRGVPESDRADAATVLTDLAEVAPVSDVRAAAQHLRNVTDPDGSLTDTNAQFERRHLTLSPLLDGMTAIDGLLDPEAAALLNTALAPFLTPADPDDHRTAAQRRADGLIQIVGTAATQQLLPVTGGERPQLQITIPPGRTQQTPGGPTTLHPVTVTRVSCDAHLTPLLLNTDGVVVNLGRTQRLFTPHQRRLLAARDRGCRWPGCHRPPAHTDAHHIVPWADGGPSDLTNAVLLCRYHHRLLHEGGWHLTPTNPTHGSNGPLAITGPHHQHLTTHPRGP